MKRLFILLPVLLVSLFAFNALMPAATASADVNDFVITRYQADYYLSKDGDNRSTLKTVDTITARFSSANVNHGLERAIPRTYDGHPVHLKVVSVVDELGSPEEYTTYSSNDNEVVRIGDADSYVHGLQTYVITYEQTDVTRYFDDTKSDEFYWNINGTQWQVPINSLTARLHLDESIVSSLNEKTACYYGATGSSTRCALTQSGAVYETTVNNLAAGENVTIALGFQPGTFAPYAMGLGDYILMIITAIEILASIVGTILLVIFGLRWSRWSSRRRELNTIIPEYLPPKGRSVSASASTLRQYTTGFSAQLIDFAVRHYIKIYLTAEKTLFAKAQYDIEITGDIAQLLPEEREIFTDIFNGRTAVGERLELKSLQNNTAAATRLMDNSSKLQKLVRGEYGLRAKDTQKSAWFKRAGWVTLVFALLTLNPVLFIAAVTAFICGYTLWPLTDTGLTLARYLKGLEMYIGVAEVDRLKMLQSPEGAVKVGELATTKGQLVKLYERVLPYAVLFGQETEWNKHLGDYYAQTNSQPTWYAGGNQVFSAAVFSSVVSSFAASAASTSASSGGSSGGGSSGGGGGGGGGGGW